MIARGTGLAVAALSCLAACDAPLSTVGVHVITLTATDSDGQQGSTSIMLTLEP